MPRRFRLERDQDSRIVGKVNLHTNQVHRYKVTQELTGRFRWDCECGATCRNQTLTEAKAYDNWRRHAWIKYSDNWAL